MSTCRKATLASMKAAVAACWVMVAVGMTLPAQAQVPTLAQFPRVPHEVHPDTWPQPDYVAEVLRIAGRNVDVPFASVLIRRDAGQPAPAYVVLPVQTEAFAFGAAFRALVGAELDRQLAAAGVQATQQTDAFGVAGPYARRLDASSVQELVKEFPRQGVISLFIGQDGIDHAYLDLGIERDRATRSVHRTVDLPDDPVKALAALADAMTGALRELQIANPAQAKPASTADFTCTANAWGLGETTPADDGERACLALAIGSLLPTYDIGSIALGEMPPASRLAWLARAYTYAAQAAGSASAARVRDLSLRQLGFQRPEAASIGNAPLDAVSSRVETLLLLKQAKTAPVRSADELRTRQIEGAVDGLPPYAAALFVARAQFADPFSYTDFCTVVRTFPAMLMQRGCDAGDPRSSDSPRRAASASETLLFQEWQMASAFKEIAVEGITQGRAAQARETFAALPKDMAAHPFMQRLRYRIAFEGAPPPGESFDALLARKRSERQGFVQSTVDLQRNDKWMAAFSITEHFESQNTNIANDAEMRASARLESKLLGVMQFDRFEIDRPRMRPRMVGEPALFLVPPSANPFMPPMVPMPMPMRPMTTPTPSQAPPQTPPQTQLQTQPQTAAFFRSESVDSFGVTTADLETALQNHPESMDLRVRVAIARLKHGGSVADTVALFNAQPVDYRTDNALAQSFLWALPAHVLFLSGEPAASRVFYERVRSIGTGSDADLMARVRVPLIDGKLEKALQASQVRLTRYDADFARGDTVGLLFIQGRKDEAWPLFLEHAQTSQLLNLWDGAATGHRMQGLSLVEIQRWLGKQGLERSQIANSDTTGLYLHRMAVTDRRPTEADIALLQNLPGPIGPPTRWAMSATLAAGALGEIDASAALAQTNALAARIPDDTDHAFLLPLYTWVATLAGSTGDAATLDDVRRVTIDADFNHLLAKALLLAAAGEKKEALRFLRASRYEMAHLTWGDNGLAGRPVLPQYEYARAVYLIYRKTGDAVFRDEANAYARAIEKVWPSFTWSYGLDAATAAAPQMPLTRCRAIALDAHSYFLQHAPRVTAAPTGPCPSKLW